MGPHVWIPLVIGLIAFAFLLLLDFLCHDGLVAFLRDRRRAALAEEASRRVPRTSVGDYPRGFVPTAFWFYPDWGESSNLRDRGAEPFWVRPALAIRASPCHNTLAGPRRVHRVASPPASGVLRGSAPF